MYLFALHFRHKVLHGERAASTCQPSVRRARRERFAAGLCSQYSILQSTAGHPKAARMTLVFLQTKSPVSYRFLFRTEIKCAFHLHTERTALSVPGTLLPTCSCYDCVRLVFRNSPSLIEIYFASRRLDRTGTKPVALICERTKT